MGSLWYPLQWLSQNNGGIDLIPADDTNVETDIEANKLVNILAKGYSCWESTVGA